MHMWSFCSHAGSTICPTASHQPCLSRVCKATWKPNPFSYVFILPESASGSWFFCHTLTQGHRGLFNLSHPYAASVHHPCASCKISNFWSHFQSKGIFEHLQKILQLHNPVASMLSLSCFQSISLVSRLTLALFEAVESASIPSASLLSLLNV